MAPTVDRHNASGETTGTVELDESVFGVKPNVPLLHQVVTAQLAAARAGTQSTRTRAEVSGGGKKPFKQKGTGRARQGSERAPHFTGGGVAFGPKPRSYRQKTPRKMVQLALRGALSDRASEGKVVVVDTWGWDAPSTKSARAALGALGLDGRILVVLTRQDEEAYKSFRNLPDVQLMLAGELNAYDVLCNDWIVFTSETLPGAAVVGTDNTSAPPGGLPQVDVEIATDGQEAIAAPEPDVDADEDESEEEAPE